MTRESSFEIVRSEASVSGVHSFLELMRAFLRRNLRGDEVQLKAYLARVQRRERDASDDLVPKYGPYLINELDSNAFKHDKTSEESVDLSFQVQSTCHSALLHSQKRLFQANAYAFYMRMDR
ncbi:hypothetical protein ALC53_12291 [Atta colombica]|uniref:Uncharacterized protein n=1 Tax=Atta colombica TaxID=520822 RepID=A0A195AZ48_9HYME|nr:hypothetical protein ALC53_12291 [Atta colombica]